MGLISRVSSRTYRKQIVFSTSKNDTKHPTHLKHIKTLDPNPRPHGRSRCLPRPPLRWCQGKTRPHAQKHGDVIRWKLVFLHNRKDCENSMRYINGTRLDDRTIRTDYDAGFIEGRQYGRGKHGGQVRDEYRTDFDPGRGGFGKRVQDGGFNHGNDRARPGMKRGYREAKGNSRGYFESANQAKIEIGEYNPGGKKLRREEMDD